MGQYYFIVNIDKKEYLHPHKFGEGLKLMEFGHSRSSILLALTVLLADGNGRGGGDIHTSKYNKAIERYREALDKYHGGKRKTRPKFPDSEKFNQPWIGRWAGDRIVIAGDYADGGKFIEGWDDETLQRAANEHFSEGYRNKDEVNLFIMADVLTETYIDISNEMLNVLRDANELPSETEEKVRSLRPDMIVNLVKSDDN